MPVALPDPELVREANVKELHKLRLPPPPPNFPLVWEPGDGVELRSADELEARAAVLNVVLARNFGMAPQAAVAWLQEAQLIEQMTEPERQFVMSGQGDGRAFALHVEALAALAWLLHLIHRLDPAAPGADNLVPYFPNLTAGESYNAWRKRNLAAVREAREAAVTLDLYYCLDWAYLEAERLGQELPGMIDSNAIGQRRWALEWAVVLHGPHQDPAPDWEEVDLST